MLGEYTAAVSESVYQTFDTRAGERERGNTHSETGSHLTSTRLFDLFLSRSALFLLWGENYFQEWIRWRKLHFHSDDGSHYTCQCNCWWCVWTSLSQFTASSSVNCPATLFKVWERNDQKKKRRNAQWPVYFLTIIIDVMIIHLCRSTRIRRNIEANVSTSGHKMHCFASTSHSWSVINGVTCANGYHGFCSCKWPGQSAYKPPGLHLCSFTKHSVPLHWLLKQLLFLRMLLLLLQWLFLTDLVRSTCLPLLLTHWPEENVTNSLHTRSKKIKWARGDEWKWNDASQSNGLSEVTASDAGERLMINFWFVVYFIFFSFLSVNCTLIVCYTFQDESLHNIMYERRGDKSQRVKKREKNEH